MSEQQEIRPHVVIVGAGFAGLRAAKAFRKLPVSLTVIDRFNYHLFQPLLYQVATAALAPAQIAIPIRREIARSGGNAQVLMDEVIDVNPSSKIVFTKTRKIPYDYLIVATGARYNYFGNDHWEKIAPGVKSIEDALEIRNKVLSAFELAEMEEDPARQRSLLNFVIVGGGPTGVEIAGSIAELSRNVLAEDFYHIDPAAARVILVEAGPKVLAGFAEQLSDKAKISLEKLGVEVWVNQSVEEISKTFVRTQNAQIPCQTIIWAAGVKATPVGQWLKVETDRQNRVPIEKDLSVKGYPDVFVLGDAAHFEEEEGTVLPGLAPVASQQGAHVVKVIQSRLNGKEAPLFRYRDKGMMATIGRSKAVAQIGRLKITGLLAWLAWSFVHILYLIDFRNRITVLLEWIWNYFSFQRGSRVITGFTRKDESIKKDNVR
jgi:NADH:ubiquinone reductase (H+-translocating)